MIKNLVQKKQAQVSSIKFWCKFMQVLLQACVK